MNPGDGRYEISLLIDTPDGDGDAPGDDDAEIDIDEVYVVLHLRHHHPPNVNHISPAKGGNDKVNVPLQESVKFTVEAENTAWNIKEYQWKKQTAGEDPPSVTEDFADRQANPA